MLDTPRAIFFVLLALHPPVRVTYASRSGFGIIEQMNLTDHISSDNLHHAYLIEGGEDVFVHVQTFIEDDLGETIAGNPDVHIREFETLGIDDARELTMRAHKKSLGPRMMILCRAGTITREAQNSLLKLMEEPPADTHFFVCVPNVSSIIPTLRSRVWFIGEGQDQGERETHARDFLEKDTAERLKIAGELAKGKDVAATQAFLDDLENVLFVQGSPDSKEALQHIIEVKKVLHDRGASLKQLLESVVILLPLQTK